MLRDFPACLALLLAVSAVLPANSQPASGPQAPLSLEAAGYTRQLWLIPAPEQGVLMRTNLFRPPGDGPFPLAVINHGSVGRAEERAKFPVPVYPVATEFFLKRGYAVMLPQRPGHGETGGSYVDSIRGECANADFRRSGLASADAIAAAIDFMRKQSFIKPDGVIVVGQSAGGWAALALASRNPKNVKAVINFAGGFGGHVHG